MKRNLDFFRKTLISITIILTSSLPINSNATEIKNYYIDGQDLLPDKSSSINHQFNFALQEELHSINIDTWNKSNIEATSAQGNLSRLATSFADRTGASVSTGKNIVVVGSPGESAGGKTENGRIYIYEITNGVPAFKTSFSGIYNGDAFGASVATDGDTIIVGSPGADPENKPDAGIIGVFYKTADGWKGRALAGVGIESGDRLGSAVALYKDTFATIPGNSQFAKVFAFRTTSQDWSSGTRSAMFSTGNYSSVALGENLLLLGRSKDEVNGVVTGSVIVFRKTDTGWEHARTLRPPDPTVDSSNSLFGASVSVSNNWVIIGAPNTEVRGIASAGRFYIMKLDSATYYRSFALQSPSAYDYFGASVAIAGENALVGIPFRDTNGKVDTGAILAFKLINDDWKGAGAISGNETGGNLGASVSIGPDIIAVGMPGANDGSGKWIYSSNQSIFKVTNASGKIFLPFTANNLDAANVVITETPYPTATPTPILQPTSTPVPDERVYKDNFENSESGWNRYRVNSYITDYSNKDGESTYLMALFDNRYSGISSVRDFSEIEIIQPRDCDYTVSTDISFKSFSGEAGIDIDVDTTGATITGYGILINPSTYRINIYKYTPNGTEVILSHELDPNLLTPTLRLLVHRDGGYIRALVNWAEEGGYVEIFDDEYHTAKIGFDVRHDHSFPASAEFDNFVLTSRNYSIPCALNKLR